MKKLLLIITLFLGALIANAKPTPGPTVLLPGDMAVISWNSTTNKIDIGIMKDLAVGTVIHISDYGWETGVFKSVTVTGPQEGDLIWTVSTAVPKGTVIEITYAVQASLTFVNLTTNTSLKSDITYGDVTKNYIAGDPIADTGDNLFIFQGTAASPTFIYGFNNNVNGAAATNALTGWVDNATTLVPTNITSQLPATLTNGTNAMGTTGTRTTNIAYNGPTTTTDAATWLSRFATYSNWTNSSSASSVGNSFSIGTPVILPIVTTSTSNTLTASSAYVTGTVDPNGSYTDVTFEYGTSTTEVAAGKGQNVSATLNAIKSGAGAVAVTGVLGGLKPGTTYYYRVKGVNSNGSAAGTVNSFTTNTANAPLIVITTDDTGTGSLREAIGLANLASGTSIIAFAPTLTGTITVNSVMLITGDLIINGNGNITLDGHDAVPLIAITNSNVSLKTVVIRGVNFYRGKGGTGSTPLVGDYTPVSLTGGITCHENLTVENVNFTACNGGITFGTKAADAGTPNLIVRNCKITGNYGKGALTSINNSSIATPALTGAVQVDHFVLDGTTTANAATNFGGTSLSIKNSSFVNISSPSTGSNGFVMNIRNDYQAITSMSFENVTVVNNNSLNTVNGGGAIDFYVQNTANLPISFTNCTIFNNTGGTQTGTNTPRGIWMQGNCYYTIRNSIIGGTENSAIAADFGSYNSLNYTVDVSNSVIGTYSVIAPATITNTNNTVLGGTASAFKMATATAYNGGYVPTLAFTDNTNPAINVGASAVATANDTRGFARDGAGGKVDAGAYERAAGTFSFTGATTPTNKTTSASLSGTLTIDYGSAIVKGSGSIRIYDASDALIKTVAVSATTVSGSVVTIAAGTLSANTTYYVLADAGAFTATIDGVTATSVAIDSRDQFTFTTGAPAVAGPTITNFTPATGPVGTLVTITGTGLSTPTAFTIGGVTAIPISNDGTTLVAMVMPGATTGNISLTTAGGTGTSSSNFTVTATPYPGAQQGNKITTGLPPGAGTWFGSSVAVSADGKTAAVGGYNDNDGAGAIWIYTLNSNAWVVQNKLVGTGAIGAAVQGTSIAISADGNTVAEGGSSDNSSVGAVWVFTRLGTTWSQQAKLVGAGYSTGSGATPFQGTSISLSADGNTLLEGAYADDSGKGRSWVFIRTGTNWNTGQILQGTSTSPPITNGLQGEGIALSADGTTAAIGANSLEGGLGGAFIFIRSGNTFTQQTLINHPAVEGADARMGGAVALSADGNTLILGGYNEGFDPVLGSKGTSWVYTRTGTTWTEQQKLTASGVTDGANQGIAVALTADGNTALIGGAYADGGVGATWVFTRTGTTWTQRAKLVGSGVTGTSGASQGVAVAISAVGSTAVIGGYMDNDYDGAFWTFTPGSSPTIAQSGTLTALSTTAGAASTSTTFNVSGTGLTAGILVTPPPGFEVSTDNITFSPTVTVGTSGNIASTAVYVRLLNTATIAAHSGNIVLSSAGATSVNVATISSTVNAAPTGVVENFEAAQDADKAVTNGTTKLNFTISDSFAVQNINGFGVGPNAIPASTDQSDLVISNAVAGVATGQTSALKTTDHTLFNLKSLWVYPSSIPGGDSPTNDGTLTFVGKKGGVTQFTVTKSGIFQTAAVTQGTNYNGFTLIDFSAGTNYSNTLIDELDVTLGGSFQYIDIDNLTFTPTPAIVNVAATLLAGTTATVNATVNPSNYAVSAISFDYSTTADLSSSVTNVAATPATLVTGTTGVAVLANLTSLAPTTTYYYRAKATNANGTNNNSAILSFTTTSNAPTVTSVSPTSGPTSGGTAVTITGTSFTGTTALTFGATSATGITVVSATQITATAPAGTGTVDIRVTTAGGTSATGAGDQFTYIASPTVTSVSPTGGPTSGGTTVTITGTSFAGTTAVTFGATAATGITVVSATQITATAPAGTGTVDVRVTTPGGTSATSAADQYTYIAAPTVTSVSPTGGPTGGGTAVTITGTSFAGTTALTFGATAATGITVVSATQITATAPAGTGTVDIRVTTAGGTSATGAGDQFTYIAAPTVTGVSPTGGPTAGGTAVTITGTNFTGASALTFGATAATGITVVSATQITATAPAGTGTVDVRVTTPGGTSATGAGDQYTYIAAPTVTSVSPTGGPTAGGTAVTITGTNFTGATALTFGATAATGITVVSATQITATAPAGTGTVDIRVTTPGGTSATGAADQFTYIAAPTVTNVTSTTANGIYKAGGVIDITVTFSSLVDVTGAPLLLLPSAGQVGNYLSGSGSATLTFRYTVQAGDNTADLDYLNTTALTLNGGTIKVHGVNVDAALTLPTPGAAGSLGANKDIVIDTQAPDAPAAPVLAAGSYTGRVEGDNITSITTPTFTGTAEAGATITLYDTNGTTVLATTTADGSGNWRVAPSSALSATTHTITVKAKDAAGNISTASTGLTILIDNIAPDAPSAPVLAAGFDTGIAGDNITRVTIPTFTGTAEAGATIILYDTDGTTILAATIADGSGNWQMASSVLSATTHTITAKALDEANNYSTASAGLTIVIDNIAPSAPSAPVLAAGSDTGIAGDNTTSITTPTFTGTAEASATVTLYDTNGTTVLATTTADGSGNWQVATSTLSATTHTITIKAKDVAGNISTASTGLTIVIDNTAPSAPSAPDLTSGSDSGTSHSDNITNVTTPLFVGSAEVNATVTLYDTDGTTVVGSGVADGDGNWPISTSTLAPGTHSITAKAKDAAGNISAASSALGVTIDTTKPTIAISSPSSNSTNIGPISYTITYADANFNASTLINTNVTLNKTGSADGTIAVTGSGTTRTVNVTNVSGAGTLGISIASGTASDLAGNLALAAGPSTTFTVTQLSQAITYTSLPAKTYGAVDFSPGAISDNSDITISYTSDNTAVATIVGSNIHIVGAGTANIKASQAGDPTHTAASDVIQQLTVSKTPLAITASAATKTYGQVLTNGAGSAAFTVHSGDLQYGNTLTSVSLAYGTGKAANAAVTTYTGQVTPLLAIGANGFDINNYTITYNTGDIEVDKAALTITATGPSKIYGTALTAGSSTGNFTPGTTQNGEVVSSVTLTPDAAGLSATTNAALAYVVTPSAAIGTGGFLASNYDITYVPYNGTVAQAPLTVTATGPSKNYGTALTTGSNTTDFTTTATQNSETITSVTLTPDAAGLLATTAAGNSYMVTPSAATGTINTGNYNITYVPFSGTVGKRTITVTATAKTKVYGDADPSLTYTFAPSLIGRDGFNGVLTRVAGENIGTRSITRNTLNLSANYVIVYNGADLTITAKPVTVTATSRTKIYGDADPELTYTTLPALIAGDSFTGALTRAAGEHAGSYPIAQGTLLLNSNYALTYAADNLVISPATLTVTADNKTKAYGTANPALNVLYSGFANNDSPASLATQPAAATTATQASGAGTYAITPSGGVSPDYTFNYVNGTLTVTKAALTITADNKSKAYTALNPTLTATYTGFVNGDNSASLSTLPTIVTTATTNTAVGTYPITASGAASDNYTISYAPGTMTISNVVLTATVDNQTKVYGQANPALTITYSGFVNGDTQAMITTQPTIVTTATAGSGAGTYDIAASGLVVPGYTINYVPGTLTVTKAPLTVTADNKARNFGAANPNLTVNYAGFVNGDTQANLSTQAAAATSATTSTAPGSYAITAAGATSANYTITSVNGTLTIIPLTNALLSNLTTSTGALSPAFAAATTTYSTSVGYQAGDFTLTSTFDPTASATINGTAVPNGSPSFTIPLVVGTNTITLVVTAQDGVTKTTYTLSVYLATPPSAIIPTNILSPNGDGKNDGWVIKDIQLYPNSTVTIYDKAGRAVYTKNGYNNDWTGTLNGAPLAQGTYYYIVQLGPTELKGYITILTSH